MQTPVGCKIIVLASSLPNLGPGALKNREDPKLLGTGKVRCSAGAESFMYPQQLIFLAPQESTLLRDANSFYKSFAIDCSRSHISVDMFLFSTTYTDIATLNMLPHYTSGQTYYYPAFSATRSEDAIKFAHEFGKVLSAPIGFEGLVRVRATKGMSPGFPGLFCLSKSRLIAQACAWHPSMATSSLARAISCRCPPSRKTSHTP